MFQEWLKSRAESKIQTEFGWQRYEQLGSTALFAPDASEILAEHGLEWIVGEFSDTDKLNELETSELGKGTYGCVYEIEDTGIAAKRYYPSVYPGGFNADDRLRQITESSILRDLRVNLVMEKIFSGDPDYVTPRYIGHLMLNGSEEDPRHYTLMTKLDIIKDKHNMSPEEIQQDNELIRTFRKRYHAALRSSSIRPILASLDIKHHDNNTPPIRNQETGKLQLGVIDQETLLKRPKKVAGELVPYYNLDIHAPWLSTGPDLTQINPAAT